MDYVEPDPWWEWKEGQPSPMAPLHQAITTVYKPEVQQLLVKFLDEKSGPLLQGLPQEINSLENERLSLSPISLTPCAAFLKWMDERGARKSYDEFSTLLLPHIAEDIRDSVMVCCRKAMEVDNFDEALSVPEFDIEGTLEEMDKSMLVKCILASTDYGVFASTIREYQMENEWAHQNQAQGLQVNGCNITAQSAQILTNVMDKFGGSLPT